MGEKDELLREFCSQRETDRDYGVKVNLIDL